VSENVREGDFERESSRLNEGLKSCRAVLNNYRAMMSGDHDPANDEDGSDISSYVSTTGSASGGYEGNSATN
jgi:hypothetical protein